MTEPANARGGLPGLLDAWRSCRDVGRPSVVALVTGTAGSTYRKPGAMALLDDGGLRFGAISGGCLEPELERRARHVLATRRPESAFFDTSDDSDRIYGSGVGCLGRIETLLMPLPVESSAHVLASLERAVSDRKALRVSVAIAGSDLGAGEARDGTSARAWRPEGLESPAFVFAGPVFSFDVPRPPSLLLLGAGPETPTLVTFARRMGWTTTLVETRRRWSAAACEAGTDELHECSPGEAFDALLGRPFDAVLVMSHSFDVDREHLGRWLGSKAEYIGLLGPAARRDALLAELNVDAASFAGRLHAPVGLRLSGNGPETIALGIAIQLQQRFAGAPLGG
ncbi:MAG TPA: XdhC family protein [Thermoanaerobaculia bacterium]